MNRTYLYLGVFLGLRKGVMFSAKTMNITTIFVIAISIKSFAIVTFSVKTITIITIIAISLPIKAIDIKPAPIEPIAVITVCIKTFNVKTIMVISVSIVTINVIALSIKTIIIKAVNVISVIDRHKPQPLDNKECLYSFYHVMYPAATEPLHLRKSDAFLLCLRENYEAADKALLPLKKNVIRNIQMIMDDYSAEEIAVVIDKVFETGKDIDEKALTRVVVKCLTEKDKPEPKKTPRKKNGESLTPGMVKFILD